jgi:hypothetical protein
VSDESIQEVNININDDYLVFKKGIRNVNPEFSWKSHQHHDQNQEKYNTLKKSRYCHYSVALNGSPRIEKCDWGHSNFLLVFLGKPKVILSISLIYLVISWW